MKRDVDGPVVVGSRDNKNKKNNRKFLFILTDEQRNIMLLRLHLFKFKNAKKKKFLFKSINIIRQATEKSRLWFQSSSSSIKGRFA